MRISIVFGLIGYMCFNCNAQASITFKDIKYLGKSYEGTKNTSFVSKRMSFLNGEDSVFINIRLPFDVADSEIIDRGLYSNCILQEGSIYTLQLKKICLTAIPKEYESYYRTNAIFSDSSDCSLFVETEKNTKYMYKGKYERYVDINNRIYEVVSVSPSSGCNHDR